MNLTHEGVIPPDDRDDRDDRREYTPGNAAATREALDEIRVAAMSDYEPDADWLIEKCNAALSAPARQCDVGTPEEQCKRWSGFCRKDGCIECKFGTLTDTTADCFARWAQTPYEAEEGGAE